MSRSIVWEEGSKITRDSRGNIVRTKLDQERALMSATPAQIRLALLAIGRLSEVEDIVATNPQAAIVWEYAGTIERLSPFITSLNTGDPPPFTDDEVDSLFLLARTMT